ncbi:ribulose-5-phosphate 4-epimerase/fuculose-1-phosphate aldolase [Paraburkholderia sp. GAS199]|uniref:class II aldolase/adducin family protein n=1 Tax=Paraburkholderia sp. GAS199 TaxID=3035126 RepID=UPI003D1CCC68
MDRNPFVFAPVSPASSADAANETQADPVAQRERVRQTAACAFRYLASLRMNIGVSGHLSIRDPIRSDCFWVNPFGVGYGLMRADDLSLVSHDGAVLEGRTINAAAFAIHAQIHRTRPDVACVVHGHPEHATAWCALNRPLDPINQDVCALYDDHCVYVEDSGLVVDMDEGERIARALGSRKAALLRNHGPLTVGRSVEEALWWFVLIERSAGIQLLAEAAGVTSKLSADAASSIARGIGTSAFGHFQGATCLAEFAALESERRGAKTERYESENP